jgi:hypothetical protein
MKKEIKTEITIKATPEKVWSIFANFDGYPEWNPFIKWIKGEISAGNKITVRLEPPKGRGITMRPEVLVFEKNSEFSWIGHLMLPGLFDGEHRFKLINNGNGTTTFIQSEKFDGILVPLFKKMLDGSTKNGFLQMNEKLKELAEK